MSTGTAMDHVDQLMLNARLRDEIEPFADDSIVLLETCRLPLEEENDFLESMLDWERSPVLPIAQWFDPELRLVAPELLDDEGLHRELWRVIRLLHQKRVVLECTDHLSDRELYRLVLRDILPAQEKRLRCPRSWLRWQCLDEESESALWLAMYADESQRQHWLAEHGGPLQQRKNAPYRRELPRGDG
jgi:hypothetical protein